MIEQFEANRNVENAAAMAAYMKNHFPFLGIKKPQRAQVQKEWLKEKAEQKEIDWMLVQQLWSLPEREYQYLALDYLIKMKKFLKEEDMEQLHQLIVTKSWWDSVDALAGHLVGEMCRLYPSLIDSYIKKWAKDDNMWLRRTAILFQLKYKEKTDRNLLESIILQNNHTKEFFLNKAIGWALREYSKTNPEWVREFLVIHPLHSLSIREGGKRL